MPLNTPLPILTSADLRDAYESSSPQHQTQRLSHRFSSLNTASAANANTHETKAPGLTSTLAAIPDVEHLVKLDKTVYSRVASYVPILIWLPNYSLSGPKSTLRTDIIAGLVIGFMLIPQGMAYGMLAGLPVQYGLYSSILPPLMYMLFGTAPHLSVGTNAPISILVQDSIASTVTVQALATDCSFDPESSDCATIINSTLVLTLISGAFYLLFYLLNFSIITSFVPDPVLSGFTTGASVIIMTSNMKHALGIVTVRGSVFQIWADIITQAVGGSINWKAFAIFVTSFALIFAFKELNTRYKAKLPVPIPEQLVVLLLYTTLVTVTKMDVPIVETVPSGLYMPTAPTMSTDLVSELIQPALICATVTYILTVNVAKALGDKLDYNVSADQEFIASAMCAITAAFTGSFLPSGSFSRSALCAEITREGTAVHNAVSSGLVVVVLVALTPALYYMPKAIMASIIFAALKNMINFETGRKLWRVSKRDWGLFMVAFVATGVLGVTWGIGISILSSVVILVKFQARPKTQTLGRVKNGDGSLYVDVKRYPTAMEVEGIKVFKFAADLHFANKDWFEVKLKKLEERSKWRKTYAIVIDCGSVTMLDYTCVKMLARVVLKYRSRGIEIVFGRWRNGAEMREMLTGMDFFDTVDEGAFFLTLEAAVESAVKYRNEEMAREEEEAEAEAEGGEGEGEFKLEGSGRAGVEYNKVRANSKEKLDVAVVVGDERL